MLAFNEINNWKGLIDSGRVICIDYGNKRTGVAISDESWIIATPLTVLEAKNIYNGVLKILKEYKISLIVVGIPIALNGGNNGAQHERVNIFAEGLHTFVEKNAYSVQIMQYDERLSTVAANRTLCNANLSIRGKQKVIDKVAASFILQGVLDRVRYKVYGQ